MGEIRIVGPGKTRGYPYPVCKKINYDTSIMSVYMYKTVVSWIQLYKD